jgi:hypothetical protein
VPLVDSGALSLTTVGLLAPHLTDENASALFESARHRTKRDVEAIVAALHPQPDIPSSIRMLPVARPQAPPAPAVTADQPIAAELTVLANIASIYGVATRDAVRALVMELVPGRTLDEIMAAAPAELPVATRCRSRGRSPTRSNRPTRPASSIAI